jgi:hypothetical protein
MNQEPENEMDLLLRNLGRLNDTSRRDGEEADVHLDPDELNAYAEKALPDAAHARYTEHLADCSRCRTLVSQLSVAAGVLIEEKAPSVVPKTSGLKAFLSSLFSPMVMRYAVPAMGLVIVASIGFMVFRQSKNERVATSKSYDSGAEQQQPGSAGFADKVLNDGQANNTPSQAVAQNKAGETTRGVPPKEPPAAPADDSRSGSKDAKSDQPVTAADSIAEPPARVAGRVDVAAASPKPTVGTAQNEPARKSVEAPPAPAETVTVAKSNEKEAGPSKYRTNRGWRRARARKLKTILRVGLKLKRVAMKRQKSESVKTRTKRRNSESVKTRPHRIQKQLRVDTFGRKDLFGSTLRTARRLQPM